MNNLHTDNELILSLPLVGPDKKFFDNVVANNSVGNSD